MKRLMLVVAIVASFAAQAAEIARVRNSDGGYIVFMGSFCGQSRETYLVIGYGNSTNNTLQGFFYYHDSAFWVKWHGDSNLKRYPAEAVTWHPDFLDGIKKDRKTY